MGKTTSVNIKPAKSGAVQHNRRERIPEYVYKDRTHLNQIWEVPDLHSVPEERAKVAAIYKQHVGQKMQAQAQPIREAIVVIKEDTTMEQLQDLAHAIEELLNVKCLQIATHLDEGHEEETADQNQAESERIYNLHAHMLFRFCDETGRTAKWNRAIGRKLQDLAAEKLNMERGVPSDTKHISPQAFKNKKEIEKQEAQIAANEKTLEQQRTECAQIVKSIKAQSTQLENIGKKISDAESKLANIQSQIGSGQITVEEGEKQIAEQQKQLDKLNAQYDRKAQMIAEKTDEYNELISVLSAKAEYTPLKNIQVVFPQIGTPPLIGREKWAEEQNTQIREAMGQAYKAIFSQLSEDAEKQCVQVQARAAKRIDDLQKTNHQMEKKNDELYRTIARKDRQLDAERVPDKDLVTDAEVWPYGERRDHYRIAFRYAGVLFNLSVSTFMERDFDLGLEARELAINHLHEVLPYCLDWNREDAESPEFRTHVASIFFSLIDSVTTPSFSAGGGGDNSSLRWDGKNDDEEAEAQRRDLFHKAYLIAKGGGGGYGRKK